jgi:hypothetical protein
MEVLLTKLLHGSKISIKQKITIKHIAKLNILYKLLKENVVQCVPKQVQRMS